MAKDILAGFIVLALLSLPVHLPAAGRIDRADSLLEAGGRENLLRAAELLAIASDVCPGSYEAAWKASRAYREYCILTNREGAEVWEDDCRKFGKLGMKYGRRAVTLKPGRIEGVFWFGCSAQACALGVGMAAAFRQGLTEPVRKSLERAYRINRMYRGGGPVKALAFFWQSLPGPLENRKRSVAYLKEYRQLFPDDPEGQLLLAGALMVSGKGSGEAWVPR